MPNNKKSKKITHVVDCGCNLATLYTVATDKVATVTHVELLAILRSLPEDSFVVSEDSHLGTERTEFSLSQPFTRFQLLSLYRDLELNGVTLKLFPQKQTPRACAYSGLKKCDENDPKSIYIFLGDHPKVVECLKNPVHSFDLDPVRKASYLFKKLTDAFINRARREKPKYSSDFCSKFLVQHLSYYAKNLSEDARDVFGLTEDSKYKKNNKKTGVSAGDWNISNVKMQAMYAIACTIIHPQDDCLRVREETGESPGWQYIKKYILRMTPFHLKGGVARSNLYYHGMKHWIIAKVKENHGLILKKKSRGGFFDDDGTKREGSQFTQEEDILFQKYRKKYCDSIREFWQINKKLATMKYIDKINIIDEHQLELEF